MLAKRQLKQQARKLIVKEGLNHQTVYDQLKKQKSVCSKLEIAEIVSRIPSDYSNRKTSTLRVIFALMLIFVFIIRSLILLIELQETTIVPFVKYSFHGLILPTLGLVGALTRRTQFYRLIGVFMILAAVSTLFSLFVVFHWLIIFLILFFAGIAVLAFVIFARIKVPFMKKIVQRELKGRTVNVYEYFFEQTNQAQQEYNEDLLDA
jgi:hypothetical protein